MAGPPYVNSAGIAALMGTLMHLRDRTSGIRFLGLNRHLEKIFRMTGFPSLVAMVRFFRGRGRPIRGKLYGWKTMRPPRAIRTIESCPRESGRRWTGTSA